MRYENIALQKAGWFRLGLLALLPAAGDFAVVGDVFQERMARWGIWDALAGL
jgi:hypothetical protein